MHNNNNFSLLILKGFSEKKNLKKKIFVETSGRNPVTKESESN